MLALLTPVLYRARSLPRSLARSRGPGPQSAGLRHRGDHEHRVVRCYARADGAGAADAHDDVRADPPASTRAHTRAFAS